MDREGKVLRINREARQLLGLPEAESRYRRIDLIALLPGDSLRSLRDAFREDRRRRFTAVVGSSNGSDRPVEVKISSVKDDGGGTRCRIGILSDLSRNVRWRPGGSSSRVPGAALGIALRSEPAGVVRGCIREIGGSREAPSKSGSGDRVRSDRLDKIIEDFLLYARSAPVDLIPLDLVDVIEEASVLIKSRPDFAPRTWSFTPPANRPRIFGDRNRLMQVFLNLGINAIQATSPQEGRISVSLKPKRFATMRRGASDRDLVPA